MQFRANKNMLNIAINYQIIGNAIIESDLH